MCGRALASSQERCSSEGYEQPWAHFFLFSSPPVFITQLRITGDLSRWASIVALLVKNPPAMQETWVQSLGLEDSLEKGMVTHSRIFAWRTPWTEESGRLQSMGSQIVRHD